ncbi:cytochrome P450 [Tribonema minus]|uniref:Cytochrome P450 n=1 Tax=Tribonema minus TaxID=303371 RepID=A0A835YLF9_9STRA|nr:cytochrome P450 [Tribonema minus]
MPMGMLLTHWCTPQALGLLCVVLSAVAAFRMLAMVLRAYYILRFRAGVPTVFWWPKFWRIDENRQKGGSLRRVLPRMRALGGKHDMYGTVFGGQAVLHVVDPEAAALVLSQSSKAPAYDHFRGFCGRGVFTADGPEWRAKRQSVNHALFKGARLDRLDALVNEHADALCAQLSRAAGCSGTGAQAPAPVHGSGVAAAAAGAGAAGAGGGAEVEMVGVLQQHTLAIIHAFLTGSSYTENKEQAALTPRYLAAVVEIRMVILARARSLWMLASSWAYRLFSDLYKREAAAMGPIRAFSRMALAAAEAGVASGGSAQGVKEGRRGGEGGGGGSAPLAELALRESHSEQRYPGSMLDEAITLLFAGQDTSAATLSWALYLLSQPQHRRYREALREEVGGVCGPAESGAPVAAACLGRLRLVDAVVKEIVAAACLGCLRLVDAVVKGGERRPSIVGYCNLKFHAQETGAAFHVPETATRQCAWGTCACRTQWSRSLHHHPDLWERPEEFRPERWLGADLSKPFEHCWKQHQQQRAAPAAAAAVAPPPPRAAAPHAPGAFMPFAAGPRGCVGQPFAHISLRVLLARLARAFDTTLAGPADKDMQAGFTVLPLGGLRLRLSRW